MDAITHKSRENSSVTFNMDFSIKNATKPIIGISTLFISLPALVYCCSDPPESYLPSPATCITKVSLNTDIESMDIFVFKDDLLQKLDCYQRVDDMDNWNGTVVSGNGERIITVIANTPYEREDWFSLKSRKHLDSYRINLEDEIRDKAVMTGEAHAVSTSEGYRAADIELKPLTSEIVLRSISCNFEGRPYEGEELSDVRVYLTNVNAESPLSNSTPESPRRIINAGKYCENDVEGFICKDMIVQSIRGKIGRRTLYPDIRLFCYGNESYDEYPGTPFTRLVVEGILDGTRYYWPIDINRESESESESGIKGGHRYVFDIRITRKGSLDPDMPVKTQECIITQEVSEWKEKERYEVMY